MLLNRRAVLAGALALVPAAKADDADAKSDEEPAEAPSGEEPH